MLLYEPLIILQEPFFTSYLNDAFEQPSIFTVWLVLALDVINAPLELAFVILTVFFPQEIIIWAAAVPPFKLTVLFPFLR